MMTIRRELESPQSLFQNPLYVGSNGQWLDDVMAIAHQENELEWDLASIMSMMAYGYAFGNRTLFKQIKRRPWLSRIDEDGSPVEMPIPPHGRKWLSSTDAATKLLDLLSEEIICACRATKDVYLLLSGGLDSRIVAGIVKRLLDEGKLDVNVTALTWGLPNSRDVALGKETAESLGFAWRHLDLQKNQLEKNIDLAATQLGATASPIHLHRMDWVIDNLPENALVLAGSYGDSVGRSEYSRRTVLELIPLRPFNYFGLLAPNLVEEGTREWKQEINELRQRAGDQPEYVYCEHQQQGHYMRGLIAQTMSVINRRCPVYQVFTDPQVYGFVWSLHPAARTDDIYTKLLTQIGYGLVSIPWARTNESLDGKRRDQNQLLPSYHDYCGWTRDHIQRQVDQIGMDQYLASFEKLGFLNRSKLRELVAGILSPSTMFKSRGHHPHAIMLWLESLSKVAIQLDDQIQPVFSSSDADVPTTVATKSRSGMRTFLSSIPAIRHTAGKLRRFALRKMSLIKYPVEK